MKLKKLMKKKKLEVPTEPYQLPNFSTENDNLRMCVAWRPKNSTNSTNLFESCNFFIKSWGVSNQTKIFNGVKHFYTLPTHPSEIMSLN